MDGEFPWIYVAMIAIAFVSWIFNRIQESTAARRRAEEVRDFEEDEDYVFEEEEFFEEQQREQAPPQPQPTEGEDAMRKLMEALGGSVVKAPEPAPAPQVQKPPAEKPPPATAAAGKKPAVRLSAEERAALDRIRLRDSRGPKVKKAHVQGLIGSMSLADLVRDPEGIRKAVLLREILDRPRAERPWE